MRTIYACVKAENKGNISAPDNTINAHNLYYCILLNTFSIDLRMNFKNTFTNR